jgi:hypothetical protein
MSRTRAAALAALLALLAGERPASPQGAGARGAKATDAWLPEGAGFRIVTELSGRLEMTLFTPRAPATDLQATCDANREAIEVSIPTAAADLGSLLKAGGDRADVVEAREILGQLYSYEGRMAESTEQLDAAYAALAADPKPTPGVSAALSRLEVTRGVAYMRLGEGENCIADHNPSRCLFPVPPEGRHAKPAGSTRAIEILKEHLARHPDDLEARWLLNVAAMTVGAYPSGLPPDQLIPESAFRSAEDVGRFVDRAGPAGVDVLSRAGGAVAEDFDGDGRFDLAVSSTDPCEPLRLFHNRGGGTFEERTREAGLLGQLGGLNVIQTDYDNDGRPDLFVMRGGWQSPRRNSLLRNRGDGTFEDVTERAGLLSGSHRTHSAAWADFDNDGLLDVFVGHEETQSQLFRNRGDGTFEDVSRKARVDRTAYTKGAVWGDYDGDGWPDLYVSNYGGPNFLYHNEGDGTFREVARDLGVDGPLLSFPTWFFDYDNDGRLDLFVATFAPSVDDVARFYLGLPLNVETMRLYHNTGHGFEDVTKALGLDRFVPAMGANFGDVDDDGFLDVYVGTGAPSYAALVPNVLFRNDAGRRFVDVTASSGTGHLQKGHGVAFADFDGDGHEDLFVNLGGFVSGDAYRKALFVNPGNGNHWIDLRLVGVKTNRAAIGAKVTLVLDEPGGQGRRYREVTSGGSFGSSPFTQHVGLGRATRIERIEVRWPTSGTTQVFENVAADQRLEITELAKAPVRVSR